MITKNRFAKMFAILTFITIIDSTPITTTAADTTVTADAGVSNQIYDLAKSAYESLPGKLKTAIAEHKTNIQILTNGDDINGAYGITYLNANKDPNGYYIWNGTAEVYINGAQPYGEVKKTVIHEVGHWLDAYMGEIRNLPASSFDKVSDVSSNTVLFKDIYAAEKDLSGWPSYLISNASEYYAESFRLFHMDPEALKATQPRTYEYIKTDTDLAT